MQYQVIQESLKYSCMEVQFVILARLGKHAKGRVSVPLTTLTFMMHTVSSSGSQTPIFLGY